MTNFTEGFAETSDAIQAKTPQDRHIFASGYCINAAETFEKRSINMIVVLAVLGGWVGFVAGFIAYVGFDATLWQAFALYWMSAFGVFTVGCAIRIMSNVKRNAAVALPAFVSPQKNAAQTRA